MATNALKKITTRAKQIRKKHPGKSWKSAIKEAGREYRGAKKGPIKRRKAVSGVLARRKSASRPKSRVGTRPKYKVIHEVRRVSGLSYTGGSVKLAGVGDISKTKKVLKSQLGQRAGRLDVMISSAKTKPEKRKLQKQKREIISELNRIK